jgi:hypothetical protein
VKPILLLLFQDSEPILFLLFLDRETYSTPPVPGP